LDALQALNRNFSESFGADEFLEGRIKSMEAAYRMQFEAMDIFDIRKESERSGLSTAALPLRTDACWRGVWWKAASATFTSTTAPGRFGTITRISTRTCASAARIWIKPRRRSFAI